MKQLQPAGSQPLASFTGVIAGVTLLSFGLTLLIFSAAYVQDLETLRRMPEAVWLFICGTPTADPLTLPLLLSLSLLAMLGGIFLLALPLLRRHAGKTVSRHTTG